uniref:Failed axon connections n=1 Tax=Strigamia maritima TaxID=126957 RepID=T1IR42_STRMM
MASEKEDPQQTEQQQQTEQAADNNQQPAQQAADGANNQAPASPQQTQRPRPNVRKTDYEQDVVYLYQFTRNPVVGPSVSPFCVKVETWLRAVGLRYENVDHRMKFKSKKGQLPFVELNGDEIADSDLIIKQLGQHFNKDLDEGLTTAQRSVSHAYISMLDHHTGWVYRWWRYNNPSKFLKATKLNVQHMMNSKIPSAILNFAFKLKFKGKKKAALSQGIGVHTEKEIYDFGKKDLLALNDLLGEKEFFFGDEPTLLDCVAFAHLVQFLLLDDMEFPPKTFLETECQQLVALVARMKDRYWEDWDEILQTLDLNTHLPKKQPEEEEKKIRKPTRRRLGAQLMRRIAIPNRRRKKSKKMKKKKKKIRRN